MLSASEDPAPAVSVIIPCRNEAGWIEKCLEGVLQFQSPPGGFEVIVVDGASDDGTREIVARIAAQDRRVRLVDNPQRTTPHALNLGILAARGETIVRVDAHTEYAPDYLVQCLAVKHETGADNVGGPALTRCHSYLHRAIAAAYHSRFAVGGALFHQATYEGPVDTVPYGCYSRARLLELGLFDERLVRNQDDELNLRLARAGGTIWQSPRIRSWYSPRASLAGLFRQYWQYGYWKVPVIQKHGRPASLRHLVPGAFAGGLTVMAPLALFSPLVAGLLAVVLAAYLVLLLAGSALTAARAGWKLLPVLPAVFPCYHLGYGLGFLFGLWDFALCRRTAGRFVALTRGSVASRQRQGASG
ncbi:MAG: glycosyltransferase family 2 protein [Armatimonadetes bacterium]|jgi:succinoglycan biosynthesis protein ExoA|nr:glycosyltransferase family 2 protein [Armatimonadota bacterium]